MTCDEVVADIRRNLDYIALARAFGMRWLQQWQQQQELPHPATRALYPALLERGWKITPPPPLQEGRRGHKAPKEGARGGGYPVGYRPEPVLQIRQRDVMPCVNVTAAVLARVRCNEVARLTVGLVSIAGVDDQGAQRQRCRWAACILEHVYRCHSRRIEVRQRAACDLKRLT